jgi:hypothetical protein
MPGVCPACPWLGETNDDSDLQGNFQQMMTFKVFVVKEDLFYDDL